MSRVEVYLIVIVGAFCFWRLLIARITAAATGRKMAEYAKEAARARHKADLEEIDRITKEIEDAKIEYDRAKRGVKPPGSSSEL